MYPKSRFIPPLLILLALAGCAVPSTVALNSSADDLMKKLGKPTETMANPAGGEFWDYAYGPAGTQTWRFGVDTGRTVRSKEQILTDARLYKVMLGASTEAQVRELLGKPGQISHLRGGPVWEWRVNLHPTWGYYFVSFDAKGIAATKGVVMDVTFDGDDKSNH